MACRSEVERNAACINAAVASGYPNGTYHWRRDGQPIASGPAGASPSGGTVAGATGPFTSGPTGSVVTLTISNVQPSDAGTYELVLTGPCGYSISPQVRVSVSCRADFDASNQVTLDDIFQFVSAWTGNCIGQPAGPCQSRSVDLNDNLRADIDDLLIFVNLWFAGC